MTNVNIPAWAGSADTMARRVKPIIHLIALGKAVSPSDIDNLVRPAGSSKNYSAKYITFLRLLGFDFTVQKDGRKIVSYTCTVEPKNSADIRAIGPKATKAKAKPVARDEDEVEITGSRLNRIIAESEPIEQDVEDFNAILRENGIEV